MYIYEKNAHMKRQLKKNAQTLNQHLWLQEIETGLNYYV